MKCSVTLLLLSISAAGLNAGIDLTLDRAVHRALAGNRTLRISALAAESESARSAEAGSRLLPRLTLAGSYNRIENGQFRLSTSSLPQPIPVGNVVVDNFVLRAGLRQPLFTGFRLSSLSDAAELTALAAEGEYRMVEQEVVYAVTAAYWGLYQARALAGLSAENVRRIDQYLIDTRRLAAEGMATRNDLLRLEVQLSRAKVARLEAETAEETAEMQLALVMGLPPGTEITLTSTPGKGAVLAGSSSAGVLVDSAVAVRPDLRAAALRSLAADEMVRAAAGGWWPQIELTANYFYNNPNQRYQPITPDFLGNWEVGVTMVFDLWNWGETGSKVEQAEAALKSAELRRHELSESAAAEIRTALSNLDRSLEKQEMSRLAVEAAAENLRITTELYSSGLATATQLLDAELDLFSSETGLSGALVDAELSKAALRKAVGTLRPGEDPVE